MGSLESISRSRSSIRSVGLIVIILLFFASARHLEARQLHIVKPDIYRQDEVSLFPRDAAANSTLGFERLIALSAGASWRTRGLQSAAKLTGLNFTVPPQPKISEEFVHAFRNIGIAEGKRVPQLGSAKAWLAHLDILKYVITSGVETAFVVEDDVDWDIRLKDQMRLISDNVRTYSNVQDYDEAPFGRDWDILWLGHCGSAIEDPLPSPLVFADDTRCDTELYSGWSKHYLQEKLPGRYRQVQNSVLTVCTFGYGVTKASAQKILTLLSTAGDEAYDVALSTHCRDGSLRCLVINPQVFNHYEPPAQHGYTSEVHSGDGLGRAAEEALFENVKGTTGNIMESARCRALFNETCMRPPSDI